MHPPNGLYTQQPGPPPNMEMSFQGPPPGASSPFPPGFNPSFPNQPPWQAGSPPAPAPAHMSPFPPTQTLPPLSPNATGFSTTNSSSNFYSPPPQATSSDALALDEGRMSVAIDFGTTFSGVAFGSSRIAAGQVQQILNWPGSHETFRKIPTCLLYDASGEVLAWGLEAKNASAIPGTVKCEWFKLFLEPKVLRDESAIDPRLPQLPYGKRPIDVIIDFLTCLWDYAKVQITHQIGAVADLNSANVWLTVPAAWDVKGCEVMREAAITAGLVQSSRPGDTTWRERLRIITEPEAAAVHCADLTDVHHLTPSQTFIVVDAGGGTVDLAVYKLIGVLSRLEIAEMAARSGANCGSIFLDLRFKELVKMLLQDHPVHLEPASLAYFMHTFSEQDKLEYNGASDDDVMFHFTCFNVEDPNDHSVGLFDGQLSIPGNLLRREVFDPVIAQVLQLIEDQVGLLTQQNLSVDALLLVGGFAGCEYLKQRVSEQFGGRVRVIARPPDADTATLRGAAKYGLAKRPLVSSIIAPRAYLMKVKLPAEQQDWMMRPAYVTNSPSGTAICENRLQYLIQKGAILRRGQRVVTRFCKYSATPQDTTFVATFYTSNSPQVMRYSDEGETTELCKWSVDLGKLPTFQQNANSTQGFYTEFDLGLELDSAEVRGILLYQGQEWGRWVILLPSFLF
ncbi:actin-like ATPase domain-containing protein [Flagelloscypha sp. PMI_526]|nr:actin-like ATPase domain-containing protein [Flagelloscypha sp. PMI_526]